MLWNTFRSVFLWFFLACAIHMRDPLFTKEHLLSFSCSLLIAPHLLSWLYTRVEYGGHFFSCALWLFVSETVWIRRRLFGVNGHKLCPIWSPNSNPHEFKKKCANLLFGIKYLRRFLWQTAHPKKKLSTVFTTPHFCPIYRRKSTHLSYVCALIQIFIFFRSHLKKCVMLLLCIVHKGTKSKCFKNSKFSCIRWRTLF